MTYDVLIMDDSQTSRAMVRHALKMTGFPVGEVVEAENGAEGLAALATRSIGLVLMDLHMPVMSGDVFLKRVAKNERWVDLPIVILSAERNMERLATMLDNTHRKYLAKPFRPEALREVLRSLFETEGEVVHA